MESLKQLASELRATKDKSAVSIAESLERTIRTGVWPPAPRELLAAACAKAALCDCEIADTDLSALIGETIATLVPIEADGKVIGFANAELRFTNQSLRVTQ